MKVKSTKTLAGVAASAILAATIALSGTPAHAADAISPGSPQFSYDAGPYTNANVSGLLLDACSVPQGCDTHDFTVAIPKSYYAGIRSTGRTGAVRIALSWEGNSNDFDMALLDKDGNPIATGGFGNSDFERIVFAELPSGSYTIAVTVFNVVNTAFHVDVSLQALTPVASAAAPATGGLSLAARAASATTDDAITFSNGTPVALERSSGEPNMEIAPNGDLYVDMPLGVPTNGVLYKSTDDGDTWRVLAPLHPNNNPMPVNPIGGGDTWTTISETGRLCYSELNTLVALGVACSTDGGKTFALSTLGFDPATPAMDRQWMATTPRGEVFLDAQFGLASAGPSQPGIVLLKEVAGTGVFTVVQRIDIGKAMKTYDMVSDPTDTSSDGGTVLQLYLRSNQGPDKLENPHQLMVWRSTDGGASVTQHVVRNLPTSPHNNFSSVDIDRQGNVYASWSEQGTWDIFYSVARKGDLDHWSKPVRVNAEPLATTAIQSTIKVGDRGRVFIGYYAAQQVGNPDALTGGVWHAYLSSSLNGACQIDANPCAEPTFHQTRITEHPVQFRGICLGGTGCGGDPYYGDRSMLEFLDLAITPKTGKINVITTDSSRANGGTTITYYRQIAGPSAFAAAGPVTDTTRIGNYVTDVAGDAGWPYESPVPSQPAPGADITSVKLSYPKAGVLRVVMMVADPAGFADAITAGIGQELLIATRFATEQDVLWAGIRTTGGAPEFVAGHLAANLLTDVYAPDEIAVTGSVDDNTGLITVDVPLDKLKTTLPQPETVTTEPKEVRAVLDDQTLYNVMGFSHVGIQTIDDTQPKHLMDVTPAFTFAKVAAAVKPAVLPGKITKPAPKPAAPVLPATGVGMLPEAWVLIAAAGTLGVWTRRRANA
jgi:hypothetical protein